MRNMLQAIDALLNRFTMYRVVAYGLAALLTIASVLAFAGVISVQPVGLLVSIAVLLASCYGMNRLFAWLLHVPHNSESWLITALILACIVPPAQTPGRALFIALCGTVAMISKYVIVYRGSHFLNPAAFGVFVMSVSGLLPVTWWIATPYLAPFTALLALVVLRKQRKFGLFLVFTLAALLLLLFIGSVLHGQSAWSVATSAFLSWPVVFAGSIMLTEPSTLPATKYYQWLVAVLVGALFASQLHFGSFAATPQAALLAGNLFTLAFAPAMGVMLRLREIVSLGPNMYGLSFERPKRLHFAPGQYLEWTLPHSRTDSRGNRRIFSIASSPDEPDVHIGIKIYQPGSSFKQALLGLKPGSRIRAAHVAGTFTLPTDTSIPLVFIAGGIGITPFRSMIRHLLITRERRDITLLYIASSPADFVYKSDLRAAAAVGLKVHYIVGGVKAGVLENNPQLFERSKVYISGPDAFVSHYKQSLIAVGVSRSAIKTDHFTGY